MADSASLELSPRALILAAGVGRRLAAKDGRPKCLLEFAGRNLLARHVTILRANGIDDVTVIAGYQAGRVRDALSAGVEVIVNPHYEEGSVVSLWTGRDVLRSGRPVVLMDADVLYDPRLMARLLGGAAINCLLLDRQIEPGDEPVKLCIAGDRIVDFHKQPRVPYDWHGESVGFFRFAPDAAAELARRTEDYVVSGRRHVEYEEPIRDMMLASPPDRFGYEDISGMPWIEIDFPEDVEKAHALLPVLEA